MTRRNGRFIIIEFKSVDIKIDTFLSHVAASISVRLDRQRNQSSLFVRIARVYVSWAVLREYANNSTATVARLVRQQRVHDYVQMTQ